jgi:hypothetical protein
METNTIKELRNRINIPLHSAQKLLKRNNNNVELSIQEFHRNKINTICRLTECDDKTAKKYYHICKHDEEKAMKKIQEKILYLTATPNQQIHKIGFILWAENSSLEKYYIPTDRGIFIQSKDFDYVIDIFKAANSETFDITGHNRYKNETMRKIVNQIARLPVETADEELFLRNLIKWFNSKLRFAEEIVVYGNL